jgi:hypothetical protein
MGRTNEAIICGLCPNPAYWQAMPNPAVEVSESLPDGTEVKAVWSHLRESGVAKLVTVHFFDRG